MIFDIKIDDKFTPKARFVSGVYRTDPSSSITYLSVVSIYSFRLGFLLESLNNLYMCAVGIGNECLNTESRDKVWCES